MNINEIIAAHETIVSTYAARVPELLDDHAELLKETDAYYAFSYLMSAGELLANELGLQLDVSTLIN